jgi:hypothetical protein
MRFGWTAQASFKRTLWLAYLASILLILFYVFIYWFQPFTEFWNASLANFILVIASFSAAFMGLMIWRLYDKTDAPRRVWAPFTLALILWNVAELIWGYLNVTQGEVSTGWPDVLWIVSYPIFGWALFQQYQVLTQYPPRMLWVRAFISILFVVAFTMLTYALLTSATGTRKDLTAVVNSFYPVADLVLAVIAFRLARDFRGGAFSRPWFGLIVFAFADLTYAWLEISGLYTWSIEQGNLLSTISDAVYVAAYFVMGITLLYQWLFLKYGMRSQ